MTPSNYEIYSISGAPRPWRALLGFVAKGIDFEVKILDASKKEQKSPAFLAINPRGRTPVIKNGDFVLSESVAILAYLDEKYPEPPIFGTTPVEHARVWQLVSEAMHDLNDAASALLGPIFREGQDDTNPEVKKAAPGVHTELRRLESLLASTPFLAGSTMSAADCVCFPHVRLVMRACERNAPMMQRLEFHPFRDTYPRLDAWASRIEAMPGYAKTFPPHWRA